ncbi:MAG TPA: hypothetical protein VK875_10545 [Euzebyales bacterium]|nr:hypothetical protein [Euzebyales bacterium]
MSARARAVTAAPVAAIAGALWFAAAVAGTWVERPLTRTVGDVALNEVETVSGTELVPVGVVIGLVALLCGVGVLATRGAARRGVSLLVVIGGGSAVAAAATGFVRANALDGAVTTAPFGAALAALVILAGGLLGLGGSARRLPSRYDVAADPGDREWQLASDPGDAQQPGGPAS